MRLIDIKRETKLEERYTPKMGVLQTNVTYIKRRFLRIPISILHKYRETYYGEVKDCKDCRLAS